MGIDCTGMGGSGNVKAIPGHLYCLVSAGHVWLVTNCYLPLTHVYEYAAH